VRRTAFADVIARAAGGETAHDLREARRRAALAILEPVRLYPRQWQALTALATATLAAIFANRRAGKTYCLGALAETRLLSRDDYVVRVLTHRLAGPSNNWLDCDGKESCLERLARVDMLQYATIKRAGDGSIKSIRFPWGSALYVHQFAGQGDIDDKHGFTADLYLADEAQYLELLPVVLRQLVLPTLADSGGQVVLAGTPGREVGSFFHRVASGDDAGWCHQHFFSWHNPVFGGTHEQRWHRIVDTILERSRNLYGLTSKDIDRLRGLDENTLEWIAMGCPKDQHDGAELRTWVQALDPALRRQYLGQWVVGGAEYVFEWHRAPNPLYWCRTSDCQWNERAELQLPVADTLAARIAMLPERSLHGRDVPHTWTAVLGVDIGWNPSSTSIVVLVWTSGLDLCYALWSEVAFKQPDDVTLARLEFLVGELRAAGIRVWEIKADLAMRQGTGATWDRGLQRRFQADRAWISPFNKVDKPQQIRAVNLDLLNGKYRLVAGDALDVEGRHLRWKPFDAETPKPPTIDKWRSVTRPNGRTERPGDHCLDALRGAAQEVPALFQAPAQRGALTHEEWIREVYAQSAREDGMGKRTL
jgi:hypothetical protein